MKWPQMNLDTTHPLESKNSPSASSKRVETSTSGARQPLISTNHRRPTPQETDQLSPPSAASASRAKASCSSATNFASARHLRPINRPPRWQSCLQGPAAGATEMELAQKMVGETFHHRKRSVGRFSGRPPCSASSNLSAPNLHSISSNPKRNPRIAGVDGNGQQELAEQSSACARQIKAK